LFSDEEEIDGESGQKTIVKFSSSSSQDSPECDTYKDQFTRMMSEEQPEQQRNEFNTYSTSAIALEPLFSLPLISVDSPLHLDDSQFLESSAFRPPELMSIPRSPNSSRGQADLFFFKYHQDYVLPGHYFRMYEYQPLVKKFLPLMTEQSETLRYAFIAFSALIYSLKEDWQFRPIAFIYYAKAIQGLRLSLDKDPMTDTECQVAVATALQLFSFDVRLIIICSEFSAISVTFPNVLGI
jgi:hypothetical protein